MITKQNRSVRLHFRLHQRNRDDGCHERLGIYQVDVSQSEIRLISKERIRKTLLPVWVAVSFSFDDFLRKAVC